MTLRCLPVLSGLIGSLFCFPPADSFAQESKLPYQENLLSALFSPAVLNDLELIGDQRGEIEEVMDGVKAYREELIQELKVFSGSGATESEIEKRRVQMQEQLETRKSECLNKIKQTLLPHQMERLRQSTVQVMMKEFAKHQKVESGLLTRQMMEYLEIDAKQAKEIRDKAKELQKELAEQIKKMQDEATKKLMKTLSAEQRKKYEKLVGEKIDQ